MNNSKIPRIKNEKLKGYYFHMHQNIQGDFQICISVLLKSVFLSTDAVELIAWVRWQEACLEISKTFVVRWAIQYHLYRLKKVKNTHGRVLLLVKLQVKYATLLKVTLSHGYFSPFLNCTNDIKSRNVSHFSGAFQDNCFQKNSFIYIWVGP